MLRFIPSFLGVLLLSLPLTLLSQTSCITVDFLPDFLLDEELEVFVVTEPAFIEGPSSVMVSPNAPTVATFCIPYGSTECLLSFVWACGEDSVLIATTVGGGPAGALLEDVEIAMTVTCSDVIEWDCPNLMGDVGMPCQDGWGVITEDCECVEDTTGGGGGNLDCLDGLDLGALMMYLMEACGNQDNPDSWWYCGLMETMNAAMAGDEEACDEFWAWIDTGEWGGEVPCGINFEVMQAWDANGELIPNELWVWIYDYDSEYTYTWDFGDESPATSDPFPMYTYGTDGPYELCVTVSSEEDSCSSVYCETVEVDSDGMIVGMMSGFTINVMAAGEPLSVGSMSQEIQNLEVYPNPVEGSELQLNWSGLQSGVNKIELMTLDGVVVRRLDAHRGAGGHSVLMNVEDLSAGIYFLRMTQGIELRTKKVVIR